MTILEMLAQNAGLNLKNKDEGRCVKCGEAFSDKNVFTPAGWKETKITGFCERCFNEVFSEE